MTFAMCIPMALLSELPKEGLFVSIAIYDLIPVADGHTASNAPDLF